MFFFMWIDYSVVIVVYCVVSFVLVVLVVVVIVFSGKCVVKLRVMYLGWIGDLEFWCVVFKFVRVGDYCIVYLRFRFIRDCWGIGY